MDRLMGGRPGGWICPGRVPRGVCSYIRYPERIQLTHRELRTNICVFFMNQFDIEALHYHIVVVARRLVACYQRAWGGCADEG